MIDFKQDLVKAGIPYRNDQGQFVDFHALRHTANTNLARVGVGERIRMAFMRHSDPRLTSSTYTDASQLPVAEAVRLLPSFRQPDAHPYAQLYAQTSGFSGPVASQPVTGCDRSEVDEPLENRGDSPVLAHEVSGSHKRKNGAGDRARTCNILVNSQTLYH